MRRSRPSARQRAGRAARQCNGEVYRMYTKQVYKEFERHSQAGVLTEDLLPLYSVIRCKLIDGIKYLNFYLAGILLYAESILHGEVFVNFLEQVEDFRVGK